MSANVDRLFELLPNVIRASDAEHQYPLRDLLRVIGEEVDNVDRDIRQMYDNLFIETCAQWVVPYIGDLVGFRPLLDDADGEGNRFLVPRRLVADTLALRRRKGTLSVLPDLVRAVTGWSATAEEVDGKAEVLVKAWRLGSWPLTRVRPYCIPRRTNCFTLSVLGNDAPIFSSADSIAPPGPIHMAKLDKLTAFYGPRKSLCLFENDHPIAPDRIIVQDLSDWCPEVFGNDVAVDPANGRVMFAERARLRRVTANYHHGFASAIGGGEYRRRVESDHVGPSLFRSGHLIDGGGPLHSAISFPATPFALYLRDLLDPEVLDSVLNEAQLCAELNRVIQGFSLADAPIDDLEADDETIDLLNLDPRGPWLIRLNRLLLEAAFPNEISRAFAMCQVVSSDKTQIIMSAVEAMQNSSRPPIHLVVEIADSGLFVEPVVIDLADGHTLELRAADGCRPTIMLAERSADIDDMVITCGRGSRVILDGLMISRHAVRIAGNPSEVVVRHCTLVPGWEIDADCEPCCGEEPSLVITDIRRYEDAADADERYCAPEWLVPTRIRIDRSIVGTVIVQRDEVDAEPVRLDICRSIVDATRCDDFAIVAPVERFAHAIVSVVGSTVIGRIRTHAIELGENSLFVGHVETARRQVGCLRFSYVPDGSRTPSRHACQPTVETPVEPTFMDPDLRYGRPDYCRLADDCAVEIREGADDESEMGVYHDLHTPQRVSNLVLALQDYLPLAWELQHVFET